MRPESTHCVFLLGTKRMAVQATSVREVMPQPEMVSVPGTPPVFAGLCHIRSEFVPVLNLDSVLSDQPNSRSDVLLVVEDSTSVFGILVDSVRGLMSLEVSDAPESSDAVWSSAVVGWALEDEIVVQVLDTGRLRELAEGELSATRAGFNETLTGFSPSETELTPS